MKTTCYAQTNIGAARTNNEDNYYCNGTFKLSAQSPVEELISAPEGEGLLFGVFDGMGGEARGEEAALAAARTLFAFQGRPFEAPAYFQQANAAVGEVGRASGETSGSTAAVAYFRGNRVFACNVGDSRVYFQRGDELRCLTHDHTRYQQLVDSGYTVLAGGDRHVLTQFLGMGVQRPLTPHFSFSVKVEPGDRVLLCSDGVTGSLPDAAIAEAPGQAAPPEAIGRALVQRALAAGSRDNLTVVVVEVCTLDAETLPEEPPPTMPSEELAQTRRFEVPPPEKIAAEEDGRRRRRRKERRREARMILLVLLAVLFVAGGIIWLALGHSPHSAGTSQPRAPVRIITINPARTNEPIGPK